MSALPIKQVWQERKGKLTISLVTLGIAGTLFALSVNRRKKTAGTRQSKLIEMIEPKNDRVTIAWPQEEGLYKVYRGEELIYKGERSRITDRKLLPGTMYSYTIERVDEFANVVEILKIQTSTTPNTRNKENLLVDLVVTTIVGNGCISLQWEPIEGISEYTIYRNGNQIHTVHGCSILDQDINEEQEYTYVIKAKRPLQRSAQMKSEVKSIVANTLGYMKKDSSTDIAAMEQFSIVKKVGPLKKLLKPVTNQPNDKSERVWKLRYTTFINDEWIKNPNRMSDKYYFKGDNRNYDPESSRFRTRADVYIHYEEGKSTADLKKWVGLTQAYNRQQELIAEEHATDDDIKLSKVLSYEDHLLLELTHSVSNPMVVSPAIDYEICGKFYYNGMIDLAGIHDQAPHHEIYIMENNSQNWQTIHQAASKGLEMMSGALANHYWRYTTFTS